MGSDQSRPDLRGLAYHDPRLTKVWGAESSYTQAGNTAGDPNPQQDTEMELEASGQQDADSTLRIQSLRGGLPGPGPMRAGFCWRDDDASDWRGWEVPTTPLGWEHVAWTDGTSGLVRGTYTPHSVTLDDGTVLVAVQAVYEGVVRRWLAELEGLLAQALPARRRLAASVLAPLLLANIEGALRLATAAPGAFPAGTAAPALDALLSTLLAAAR